MRVEEVLKEYGLSDKETKVYLELLSLGSVNLQEVAKRLDLPRTTIYNTLNYLVSKGLTSFIIKRGVRFYEAAEPSKLVEKLSEKQKLLDSVLPELESLKKVVKESSNVEIFQGSKGLFTILSDVFKINQQTYYFGSYSLSKEVLKHQPDHVRAIRLDRKISAKIVIDEFSDDISKNMDYQEITEMKINKSLKNFPCMIFIYGKKVALYTLKKDLVGVIISNAEVADAMKIIFDMYWSNSK